MFSLRPKLPEPSTSAYSAEEKEFRKEWYQRGLKGELLEVVTPEEFLGPLIATLFMTLVFGSIFAILVIWISNSILLSLLFYLPVFYFAWKNTHSPYAISFFDPDSRNFSYRGLVEFGGTTKFTDYVGPIDIVEGVQIARPPRSWKKYVRLITNTGYLRLPFPLQQNVTEKLIELDIFPHDFQLMQPPITLSNGWKVYFERTFDRGECFEKKKKKREKEREERMRKRLEEGKIKNEE